MVDSGRFDWSASDKFPSLSAPEPAYHGLKFHETFGAAAFTFHGIAIGLRDLGMTLNPQADAGKQVVKTDIPKQMLSYFVQLGSKAKDQPVTSYDLTPPDIDPENPDYDVIRAKVQELVGPKPTETPAG